MAAVDLSPDDDDSDESEEARITLPSRLSPNQALDTTVARFAAEGDRKAACTTLVDARLVADTRNATIIVTPVPK